MSIYLALVLMYYFHCFLLGEQLQISVFLRFGIIFCILWDLLLELLNIRCGWGRGVTLLHLSLALARTHLCTGCIFMYFCH